MQPPSPGPPPPSPPPGPDCRAGWSSWSMRRIGQVAGRHPDCCRRLRAALRTGWLGLGLGCRTTPALCRLARRWASLAPLLALLGPRRLRRRGAQRRRGFVVVGSLVVGAVHRRLLGRRPASALVRARRRLWPSPRPSPVVGSRRRRPSCRRRLGTAFASPDRLWSVTAAKVMGSRYESPALIRLGGTGIVRGRRGSARAKAPPRPHMNRPETTKQADAATCTRVPTRHHPSRQCPQALFIESDDCSTNPLGGLLWISNYSHLGRTVWQVPRTIVLGCSFAANDVAESSTR